MSLSELDAARRAFKRLEASKRRRGYRDVQRDGAGFTTPELAAPFASGASVRAQAAQEARGSWSKATA